MALAADSGGRGADLLVLLHGLGATREVWRPLAWELDASWSGRWIAFDLPGHGRSPSQASYSLGSQAARVAEGILAEAPAERLVVLGHSMGGAVALALASGWFGVRPAAVAAIGVKTVWTDAELEGLSKRAGGAPKVTPTCAEAADLYARVSGLTGLTPPDDPMILAGVRETDGGWRLRMDPRANSVGAPPMVALTAAAAAPFALACGEQDGMADPDDLRRWAPKAQVLAGLGHNAMVQDPKAVWQWAAARLGGDS